jgi:hypothetical protein
MKLIISTLFLSILFTSCQPPADNSANEAFEKNSKMALAEVEGWENESIDYDALYASNAVFLPTSFNSSDSISLDDAKKGNDEMWAMFDFDLLNDPVVFLPGVNPETKQADGSVRYYGIWKVTLPATDSAEERSGELKMYESFDFDSEGKIVYQQGYGDFGGIMAYLLGTEGDGDDKGSNEEGEITATQ